MLFGKKKKVEIVESTPVKQEFKCSERNCLRCGATCVRTEYGNFRCKFCGSTFTDEDAERIAEQQKAAAKAKENAPAPAPAATVQNVESAPVPTTAPTTEAPAPKKETTVETESSSEDVYANNAAGVVEIITSSGVASGLIISRNGFVLTNAHAVLNGSGETADRISVKLGGETIPASLIAIGNTDSNDATNVDLALLQMESVPAGAISLKLGASSNVRIGQHIYYIGNSKGEGLCMTAGIISDNCRKVGERYFIMTDAATNPGNSGGPLFDDNGVVIGIHVSARVEADGMKYAIPVDTAKAFLNAIEEKLGLSKNVIADNIVSTSDVSNESMTVGAVLALVISGITVLVKALEFAKDISEALE